MNMAKGNQKAHADIVEQVLGEIANDRKAAHVDLRKHVQEYRNHLFKVDTDPEVTKVVQAADEAAAALRSHERYKAKMAQQDWDARQRELTSTNDEVQATLRTVQKREMDAVAPLKERIAAVEQRIKELDGEWRAHRREAGALGIDLKKFWSPENPQE